MYKHQNKTKMTLLDRNIYRGQVRMRGSGLGGLFARLFRSSIPYLKTIGRYAKNQLIDAGAGVLNDMQRGVNVKEAFRKNAFSTRDRIVSDIKRKMSGRGVKRHKKGLKKKTKRLQKTNKKKTNKKKNHKRRRKSKTDNLF